MIPMERVVMLTATSKHMRTVLAGMAWLLPAHVCALKILREMHDYNFTLSLTRVLQLRADVTRGAFRLLSWCDVVSLDLRCFWFPQTSHNKHDLLSVRGNQQHPMQTLMNLLDGCTSLTKLNLASNDMDAQCLQVMFERVLPEERVNSVTTRRNPLHVLMFDSKNQQPPGSQMPYTSYELSSVSKPVRLNSLIVLDLHNNGLGTMGMAVLSKLMRACTALTDLRISRNIMDGESLYNLCDYNNTGAGFAACTSLTALDLHSNNVRSGWHYFGQLRKGLPLLTMLDVSNSFSRTFRRSPFSHISGLTQMLTMSPKLAMLDVSNSGIDTEEAVLLAELLRNAECLQNVNLARNKAEDDGAMHFLHCLAECPKLTSITLTENNMSVYGKHKFKYAASMITTLTKLPWDEIVSL